jgi:hypothetical protein
VRNPNGRLVQVVPDTLPGGVALPKVPSSGFRCSHHWKCATQQQHRRLTLTVPFLLTYFLAAALVAVAFMGG